MLKIIKGINIRHADNKGGLFITEIDNLANFSQISDLAIDFRGRNEAFLSMYFE